MTFRKLPQKSRILALLLCLAGLVSVLLCSTAQAFAAAAPDKKITGAVLPEPKSFFNNEIKFTTTVSSLSEFGTMTTGDFKYKDLALAQEYVLCIVDHYPFSLDSKIKFYLPVPHNSTRGSGLRELTRRKPVLPGLPACSLYF